jgi:chemotaxis protein CheC
MTTVFIESSQYDEYMMSIETKFTEGNRDINGFFLYIPEPGSLEKLIKALGLGSDSDFIKRDSEIN